MTLPTFSILESDGSPALKVFDSRQRAYLIPMLHCLPSMEPSVSSGYTAWLYTKNPGDGNALVSLPSAVSPLHSDTALRLYSSKNNGIQLTPNGNSFISSGNLSLLGGTQATSSFFARNFETTFNQSQGGAKIAQNQSGSNYWGTLSLLANSTTPASASVALALTQTGIGTVLSCDYQGRISLLGPSSGVSFGSSLAINTLSKYESNSFVPSILIGGNIPSILAQKGFYTRVGDVVTVSIFVKLSSKSGLTGNIRISNLPFSVRAFTSTPYECSCVIGNTEGLVTPSDSISLSFVSSSNHADVTFTGSVSGVTILNDSDITNGFGIRFTGSYLTS